LSITSTPCERKKKAPQRHVAAGLEDTFNIVIG